MAIWTKKSIFRDCVKLRGYTDSILDDWDVPVIQNHLGFHQQIHEFLSSTYCNDDTWRGIFIRYPKTSWPRDPASPVPNQLGPFARTVSLWKIVIFQPRKMGRKRHETDARHPVIANLISPNGSGRVKSPMCVFFQIPFKFFFGVLQKDSGKKHAWIFRGATWWVSVFFN